MLTDVNRPACVISCCCIDFRHLLGEPDLTMDFDKETAHLKEQQDMVQHAGLHFGKSKLVLSLSVVFQIIVGTICVYVCVCVCVCVCARVCTYMYTCMCVSVYVQVCMHTCVTYFTFTIFILFIYIICTCVAECAYSAHVCVWIMCVCVCTRVLVHTIYIL